MCLFKIAFVFVPKITGPFSLKQMCQRTNGYIWEINEGASTFYKNKNCEFLLIDF